MKTIRLQSKRALRTALLIMLLSAVGMTKTYAQSFTIGDLNYSVNDDGVSVTVTSHVDGQSATGTLTIPESVSYEGISYAVTTIGEWAFDGCQNLSGGLNIPNSVTTIGQGAFEACKGFSGVLAIPSFVTEIGDIAFSSCIGFSHLSIPDAVTTIGTQAFAYCCFEGELNISKNVKKIGEGAFTDCLFTAINVDSKNPHYKSQNGILFTHGMDTLMQYPKGKSETSYNIPNSVKRINSEAFYACFLTDVTIPNSVTSIGSCAFCGHWLLEDNVIDNIIYLDGWCLGIYDAGAPTSMNIQEGTRGIADGAFYSLHEFADTLSIPNSLLYIGNNAFENCGFTGPLVIPNSVVSIGDRAFYSCDDFSGEFFFGNSVASIGEWAFAYCTGVNGSLTIPKTTISIGESPFFGCDGIERIVVDRENPKYDSRNDCNAIIETATNTLISGCKNTIIPNSVYTIGKYAFAKCHGLTGPLTIPNSVVTIEDWAFVGCSGLTGSLIIPHSVVTIGDEAFYYCEGLTGVLVISSSVEFIGEEAFGACSFDTVVSLNDEPPFFYEDYPPFYNYINLIVSCGSKESYEASSWVYICNTIEEDCILYNVIIDDVNMSGGNVTASVNSANFGEEVRLTIAPNEGMILASLIVSNVNDPSQTVTVYPIGDSTSAYGFTMPPFDVIVKAMFVVNNAVGEGNNIAVSAYPNPTNGQVKIEAESLKYISISNTLGQVIYEGIAEGDVFEYDFNGHEAGIYLVRIETENGVAVKKISATR